MTFQKYSVGLVAVRNRQKRTDTTRTIHQNVRKRIDAVRDNEA